MRVYFIVFFDDYNMSSLFSSRLLTGQPHINRCSHSPFITLIHVYIVLWNVPPSILTFPLSPASLYALSCLFFAYAEGYKGFHLKFAPLVVKRSFSLLIGTPQGNNPVHYLLAPPYSMGLFHATRKRLVTSWSVTLGVGAIVAAVKRLSPVPRCIVDAGVIVGLTLGSVSILYHYVRSIVTGTLPDVDACLPAEKPTKKE
jgi:hypothetical protein